MIPKPIDQIDYEDLATLVANQVPESRTLEFKRELPGRKDADVKEFLADISALANTNGGDLVFGVEEEDGVASALPGLSNDTKDETILRLESIAHTSLDPRISGLGFHWLTNAKGSGFLVIRVPASFAAPHRVTHGGSSRFYGRGSNGKYPMDTYDLRLAFTASEGLPSRLRALHEAARASASGVEFPFKVTESGPYVVISVMPLALFREKISLPVDQSSAVPPARRGGGWNFLRNLDGMLCYVAQYADGTVRSYSMLHSSGRLDAAWQVGERDLLNGVKNARLIWADYFEKGLVELALAARSRLAVVGVEGPWAVFVTIENTKGYSLELRNYDRSRPSWLSSAKLPELIVDQISADSLRPLADQFWLAFGVERPGSMPFPPD
jgi:hypothetical protein